MRIHDGLLTEEPFDETIEFMEFDYWHYYGRTAKHGAFMGGGDFFPAWAGFVGNFGLSLLDHAQNGFFYWEEWIAVVGAAPSVGFVLAVLIGERSRGVWLGTWITLGVQAVVGVLGAALHL